jgi:DNA repair exonuclease SbcCD ATPase subunit
VSILRSQLSSKNAEVETERLTRAQELESQAQEYRDKLKDLQKDLEHTRTQLEFKVRGMSLITAALLVRWVGCSYMFLWLNAREIYPI